MDSALRILFRWVLVWSYHYLVNVSPSMLKHTTDRQWYCLPLHPGNICPGVRSFFDKNNNKHYKSWETNLYIRIPLTNCRTHYLQLYCLWNICWYNLKFPVPLPRDWFWAFFLFHNFSNFTPPPGPPKVRLDRTSGPRPSTPPPPSSISWVKVGGGVIRASLRFEKYPVKYRWFSRIYREIHSFLEPM